MNRRGFLAALAGAMVMDPERLFWKPGAKLISIPKPISDREAIERYVQEQMDRAYSELNDRVTSGLYGLQYYQVAPFDRRYVGFARG